MIQSASGLARWPALLLERIARDRVGILRVLVALAVVLRVLMAAYCPTPFGYVYDYYHEAVALFWQTGRLPIASDCWQCYHPPVFYVSGLPFYAFGRWMTAGLDSSPEWGLRCLTLLALTAGAVTALYSAKLVDRLVPDRALSVMGIALVFAFPCLFISSYGPEADIVVSAFMTMFVFYLTEWQARPAARWRWPAGLGLVAGLAAATKYSGLIALATAGAVLGTRLLTGPARLRVVRDGLIVLTIAVVVGGWKYADNVHRYGTPLFANGSAGDAFSSSRENYRDRYDFASFSPRAIVRVAQPGSPPGELTTLPVYRSVWTTLYGMAWTGHEFLHGSGGIGDPAAPYPWKRIPSWLSGAVVHLALLPSALAVLGGILLLRRREYLPLHLLLALTLASYLQWVIAQDDWALKTKYILFLLPIYVTYAMTGAAWVIGRAPRIAALAVLVALIALVIAAHAYQLAFALGHLPWA